MHLSTKADFCVANHYTFLQKYSRSIIGLQVSSPCVWVFVITFYIGFAVFGERVGVDRRKWKPEKPQKCAIKTLPELVNLPCIFVMPKNKINNFKLSQIIYIIPTISISRQWQYKDVYRRTIKIPKSTRILKTSLIAV